MNWPPPAGRWPLAPGQVHIWATGFKLPAQEMEACAQLLSPEERTRASRFHFDRDREAYTVTHAILRRLLAQYTERSPEQLQFETGPHGKPHLKGNHLRFNIAHTRGLALLSFCWHAEIGVDVEWKERRVDFEGLVMRYFTAREQAEWKALSEAERPLGFFHAWTRKEAVMKASGRGLAVGPDEIDVSLTPGQPVRVIRTPPEITPPEGWFLWELDPANSYSAALALPSEDWDLCRWQYPAQKT